MKTELQAGKEAKKGSKGYDLQVVYQCESSLGSEWPYWKEPKQTWQVKETKFFSTAWVKTSPVKIYLERTTGLNLACVPGLAVTVCNLLEWAWQTPTKQLDIPLLPLVKSHVGGWLIHLLWKGVAPNSTQCPWLSTPFIHLPTSVWAEPLMEIAMKAHIFKTWFVGVFGKFIPSWQQNTSGCGAKLELKLYAVPFSKLIKSR